MQNFIYIYKTNNYVYNYRKTYPINLPPIHSLTRNRATEETMRFLLMKKIQYFISIGSTLQVDWDSEKQMNIDFMTWSLLSKYLLSEVHFDFELLNMHVSDEELKLVISSGARQ